MSNREFQPELDDELISAYLDDELSAEERAAVEARLASDPEAQQLLHHLRAVSQSVQRLPLDSVGRDLRGDVLQRIAEMRGGPIADRNEPNDVAPVITIFRTRRSWIWASLAVAAGLLIMVLQSVDDANKKKLAAARVRSAEATGVGRELSEAETLATGATASATSPTRERVVDQPALKAKDESQVSVGVPVVPAAPAPPPAPASAEIPVASPAPASGEFRERPMPSLAERAPAEAPPAPVAAARAADTTAEKIAPAVDAVAVAKPGANSTDGKLAFDRAPSGGMAGKPTALGGAFGAMNAPASAAAAPEGASEDAAPGMAAGARLARPPSSERGVASESATPVLKGTAVGEAEAVIKGQEPETRDRPRRGQTALVVDIVAKPAAIESQEFANLLQRNGIAIEPAVHDKQEESVVIGEVVKQRSDEERLSTRAAKGAGDEVSLIVVEAPRATMEAFLAEVTRDRAHFTSVSMRAVDKYAAGDDTVAGFKKAESLAAELSDRDQRGDVQTQDTASSSQRYFQDQTLKDSDGKDDDNARAKSNRGRDEGTLAGAAGRANADETRKKLAAAVPARGWARRVTSLDDEAGRRGGSGQVGGGALGPGEPAAPDSPPVAKAGSVELKMKLPATEDSGKTDNLRVLFVIRREAGATPSAASENQQK